MNQKRLVLAGLDQEGFPVSVQELIAGEWHEVSIEVYYAVPSDVYLIEDSADSGRVVWTDGDGFMLDANIEEGQPPSPEEAEEVFEAYLQHITLRDSEDVELKGLVFTYEATAAE